MTTAIRPMTRGDVAAGMALGRQNGWNQLEADWLRFLDMQPDGCFVAETNGRIVGTSCSCIFGSVAWIAMVLVDSEHRRQGIGTALMNHVLAFLDEHQTPTIRLDATPLGRPIYEKLGFVAEYELHRYAGVLPNVSAVDGVATAVASDLKDICALDASINFSDRQVMFERLFREHPQHSRVIRDNGRLTGFAFSRRGANAVQIGPCMATADAGPLLLIDAFHRRQCEMVYVDVPMSHEAAVSLAHECELTVQRSLLRMIRGQLVSEKSEYLWASSGPEKG